MTRSRWRTDLDRSLGLFRDFLHEQDDPDRFYAALSRDSVEQVAAHTSIPGKVVVDIGGGRGYFRDDFLARGATYFVVDPDTAEMCYRGTPDPRSVRGDGMRLPLRAGSVDITFSSNALEHVPHPEAFAEEMVRVTRPGGLIYLAYTNWLSPNGGHETKPWHLVIGGRRAADRFAKRHGHRPKNDFGRTLFAVSAGRMLRWADAAAADGRVDVVARRPRYHPSFARRVIDVPGARELLSWNVLIILRRRQR
jgi:SAM-dependent methyltransferase